MNLLTDASCSDEALLPWPEAPRYVIPAIGLGWDSIRSKTLRHLQTAIRTWIQADDCFTGSSTKMAASFSAGDGKSSTIVSRPCCRYPCTTPNSHPGLMVCRRAFWEPSKVDFVGAQGRLEEAIQSLTAQPHESGCPAASLGSAITPKHSPMPSFPLSWTFNLLMLTWLTLPQRNSAS